MRRVPHFSPKPQIWLAYKLSQLVESAKHDIDLEVRPQLLLSDLGRKLSEGHGRSLLSHKGEPGPGRDPRGSTIGTEDERYQDNIHMSVLLSKLKEKDLDKPKSPLHQKVPFSFYRRQEDTEVEMLNDEDYRAFAHKRSMETVPNPTSQHTLEGLRMKIDTANFNDANFQTFGYDRSSVEQQGHRNPSIKYLNATVHALQSKSSEPRKSNKTTAKLKEENEESFESEYQAFKNQSRHLFDSAAPKNKEPSIMGQITPKASSYRSKSNQIRLGENQLAKQSELKNSSNYDTLNKFTTVQMPEQSEFSHNDDVVQDLPEDIRIKYSSNTLSYATQANPLNQGGEDVKSSRGTIKHLLISGTPEAQRQKTITQNHLLMSQQRQEASKFSKIVGTSATDFKNTLFTQSNSLKLSSQRVNPQQPVFGKLKYPNESNAMVMSLKKIERYTNLKSKDNLSSQQPSYRNNFEQRVKISPINKLSQSQSQISGSPPLVDPRILEKYMIRKENKEQQQQASQEVSNFNTDKAVDYNVFLNSLGPQNDHEEENLSGAHHDEYLMPQREMLKSESIQERESTKLAQMQRNIKDSYSIENYLKGKLHPMTKVNIPLTGSIANSLRSRAKDGPSVNDISAFKNPSKDMLKDVYLRTRHNDLLKVQQEALAKLKAAEAYRKFNDVRRYKL